MSMEGGRGGGEHGGVGEEKDRQAGHCIWRERIPMSMLFVALLCFSE